MVSKQMFTAPLVAHSSVVVMEDNLYVFLTLLVESTGSTKQLKDLWSSAIITMVYDV